MAQRLAAPKAYRATATVATAFDQPAWKGSCHIASTSSSRGLTTDPEMNVRLARAGAGITMVREDRIHEAIAAGELVPVLEEYCTPFPGYFLYFPQRRQASPALRALVEYVRGARRRAAAAETRPATARRGAARRNGKGGTRGPT